MPLVKQRKSNLELLRILSMMLVMLGHFLGHNTSTGLFPDVVSSLANLELRSIAIICVHCFILISGYFGIHWKVKSFFGLIFQITFWAFLGYYIYVLFILPLEDPSGCITLLTFIKNNLLRDYSGRWFIAAYITLYFLSPLANKFVETVSQKQLLKYILIFYAFSTVFGYFMLSEEFNTGMSAISLLGLYILGAWLRKSNMRIVHWSLWYDLVGFIICTLLLTFGSALLLEMRICKSIYGYLNPIVIIESMFLFQFFRKLNFGYITWINYLASSAFAAFLLHCHSILGSRWTHLGNLIKQSDYAFLYALIFIVGTFLIAVILDKVRILIWNVIIKVYHIGYNHITHQTRLHL